MKRACYIVRLLFADRYDVKNAFFKMYGRVSLIGELFWSSFCFNCCPDPEKACMVSNRGFDKIPFLTIETLDKGSSRLLHLTVPRCLFGINFINYLILLNCQELSLIVLMK